MKIQLLIIISYDWHAFVSIQSDCIVYSKPRDAARSIQVDLKLITFIPGCLHRYGLRLARISSTRLWPLLLLLPSSHLLPLWHIQTHLCWFVLV